MRVTICKFCDYAGTLKGEKGCLIGMFDSIAVAQFPFTHPRFHACVELDFEPAEGGTETVIEVSLVDDDGRPLFAFRHEITIPIGQVGRNSRMMQDYAIDNLVFERPGTYRLDVRWQGEPIAEERLFVAETTD